MKKYRKSDQYYIDEYDRSTIEKLKELEEAMLKCERLIESDDKSKPSFIVQRRRFLDTGAMCARNKNSSVRDNMEIDERKDTILEAHPAPSNIKCNTCSSIMILHTHDFLDREGRELIYIFSCAQEHLPLKTVYPNGTEYITARSGCSYCGSKTIGESKRTKTKIIITDKCQICGKIDTWEVKIGSRKIRPIDERERKKYCDDFIGSRTLYEDLKLLANLPDVIFNQQEKALYNFDKVKMLNVIQLEEILIGKTKNEGFLKFQIGIPKNKNSFLIVDFSVHDKEVREMAKSIKALKKIIDTQLFHTNWRLMSTSISYNLGFLSGQLKGYSLEEDILKIAKEIHENISK